MDISDLSATYVSWNPDRSWNPGQKLETMIYVSHFGSPQIPNQVHGINVLTLDYSRFFQIFPDSGETNILKIVKF
jgi:hypothetical protein